MHGVKVAIKKIFFEHGGLVEEVGSIQHNDRLFLSMGQPFVPVNFPVLSVNMDKVIVHDLWGCRTVYTLSFFAMFTGLLV